MTPSSEFNEFLAEDESVVNGVTGTLIDSASRSEGAIGITDRRILFLSDGDRFVDVAHDAISSIQSRPRTRLTSDGKTNRLLLGVGGLIVVSAFVGVLGLGAGGLSLALMALTVATAAGAEYVRRTGSAERGSRDDDLVVLGLVTVALTSLIGLVVLTEDLLVIPLSLLALAGLVLADYANQRKNALDELGADRRREREVGIHLASGRSVYLRVDAGRRIDQDLSGVVRGATRPTSPAGLPRSSA